MKEDRQGTLVCVCAEDGRILLNAPYDSEDCRVMTRRQRRISAPGAGGTEGRKKEAPHENMDTERV